MPLEPKQILDYLGIDAEKADSLDSFKENFDTEYLRKSKAVDHVRNDDSLAAQIYGKKLGSMETDVKGGFKSLGVEFDADEIKGKPVDEIIKIGIEKASNRLTELKTEFETSKTDVSERETKLSQELETYKTRIKEDKDAIKSLQTSHKILQEQLENKDKEFKLTATKIKDFSDLPLNTSEPLRTKGFKAHLEENFKWTFDETGAIDIVDKEGKRIPNPDKQGSYKTRAEVLKDEAIKFNLFGDNINKGKEVNKTIGSMELEKSKPSEFQRKINPRALQQMGS